MKSKDSKQRLFEVMQRVDPTFKPKLNESDAFNDAGEPMMTHQQFRDYSEPSEPDYDDDSRYDYDVEQNPNQIVKEIQKHFNTILETYDGEEYKFLTKSAPNHDINGDLNLYINNNIVSASAEGFDGKEFPEIHIEELAIDDLIKFFEPYRQYILSGAEAEKEMTAIQKQNSADRNYERQERSAMGGG